MGRPPSTSTNTFALKQSKVSGAWLQNIRLDFLWRACNNAAVTNQYSNWNNILDRLWSELSGDIPEGHPLEKRYLFINKKLSDLTSEIQNTGSEGFVEIDSNTKDTFKKQRIILMEKEIFIRRLTNQLGKGTKYVDENEDDWE